MKKRIILSVCSGFILVFAAQTALANDIPTTSLPMSKILQVLQSKGYSSVRKVEFEHGTYEVKAISAQGKKVKLNVNPQTGVITNNSKTQNNSISMLMAAQKVEAAGYHGIYKIKSEDGKYEIKALNKDNKKVELKVNVKTGEIKKEGWFD
ncbi:MAG: hypothetical protein A3F46_03780 [Legionellales bacterium RIFCSPHIGHO2_12_FULL_42_9]|nr:MAG: hypothetical protein A3F46_03780 [Legionellales bacterium RIFCSPHIGHO2_12_FULL_42_9]